MAYYWTGGDLPTFVTHLECSLTGERHPADTLQGLSRAGRSLLVRYDLDGVPKALPHEVALAEIEKNAGSQFCPECVRVFCDLERKRIRAAVEGNGNGNGKA